MIENYAKLGTTSEAAPGQRDNGLNGRSAASTAAAAATATATAGRPGSSKLAGGFFDQPGGGGGGKKTAAASASPGRWPAVALPEAILVRGSVCDGYFPARCVISCDASEVRGGSAGQQWMRPFDGSDLG
eukprot:SAG25_NODE_137_length_14197_cov_30.387120_12_plen_130_part_00